MSAESMVATALAEEDAGVFSGVDGSISFSHSYGLCKPHQFTFKSNGADVFTGGPTNCGFQSGVCAGLYETVGFCQPFTRNWEFKTSAGQTAFGMTFTPGIFDFMSYDVKDASGQVMGNIKQPSLLQRWADIWRNQMTIALRVTDSAGKERWTLRRPNTNACLWANPTCERYCEYKPPAMPLCDYCDGRECDIGKFLLDCSDINLANCNGRCDFTDGVPPILCYSCNDCCDHINKPCCDLCWSGPNEPCCNWGHCYPWNWCPGDHNPICGRMCNCCRGCDVGDCCVMQVRDGECCYRPCCDYTIWCCSCQFRQPGCKKPAFKCTNGFKLCQCTNCIANIKACCTLECQECKRCLTDCPDCGTKCKTFYSKCKPQVLLECDKCKRCPNDCKVCMSVCPRRCYLCLLAGGRPVHIELDVYGPDGTEDVAVAKIQFDGFTGNSLSQGISLRPGYQCTVTIPSTSPYYQFTHGKSRACDYHDLALLTSLALWYDHFCIAPYEWIQCVDKPELTEPEALPAISNTLTGFLDVTGNAPQFFPAVPPGVQPVFIDQHPANGYFEWGIKRIGWTWLIPFIAFQPNWAAMMYAYRFPQIRKKMDQTKAADQV